MWLHNHFKKAQAYYYLCINYTILLSVSLYDTYTNTYTEHTDLYIMVDSTNYMFQQCTWGKKDLKNTSGNSWVVPRSLIQNCKLYKLSLKSIFKSHIYVPNSSKCVSGPSSSVTEHTSLAFKKVVHLLTRLRSPPVSFWNHFENIFQTA